MGSQSNVAGCAVAVEIQDVNLQMYNLHMSLMHSTPLCTKYQIVDMI